MPLRLKTLKMQNLKMFLAVLIFYFSFISKCATGFSLGRNESSLKNAAFIDVAYWFSERSRSCWPHDDRDVETCTIYSWLKTDYGSRRPHSTFSWFSRL